MVVDEHLLTNCGMLGVAVSGGVDSMALLHWCARNGGRLGFKTVAVNVDHCLRPQTSAQDSKFVSDYCHQHNIPLYFKKADALKDFGGGGSIEAAAKRARYDFFYSLLAQEKADLIATAHHMDDQAETVLLNLFRGSGLKGARGIAAKTADGIVRPLLKCSKADIERYVAAHNIPYVTDESNADIKFRRNYIRHKIMPLVDKEFFGAVANLADFAERAAADDECLELLRPQPIARAKDEFFLPDKYFALHPSLLIRTVFDALRQLGADRDIESSHIAGILKLPSMPTGTRLDIKSGVVALRTKTGCILALNESFLSYPEFTKPFAAGMLDTPTGTLNVIKTDQIPDIGAITNHWHKQADNGGLNVSDYPPLYLDADKIPNSAVVRYRLEADRIAGFNGGTAPLKKFFQNYNIDLIGRRRLPVIAVGNNVLAVAGVQISGTVKITKDTKYVYKISFKGL